MNNLVLTHGLDGKRTECSFCLLEGDINAHTHLAYLPAGLEGLQSAAAELATASVATLENEYELTCWCGHSLHYADCPDRGGCHSEDADHPGACRTKYLTDTDAIEARWYCVDANESEHWPKGGSWVDDDDHSQGFSIRCGHCGSSSIVMGNEVVYDRETF